MLNLWSYRPTAIYAPEHAHLAGTPCTGAEAMARYVSVLRDGLIPEGAEVTFRAVPVVNVIAAEGESWDIVAINKYPSLESFKGMIESERYRVEALPHRLAGQEDTRLIMMEGVD
ncbi:uncharacterized protein N0V89_000075 [Didymosphaeria variabile]|uniref:DUF1330 domain-containing protein n=1 Tax=Didymosphaeria variabile TaxID=1932322 RepID=A0A9W8XW38_9PLEO|nr:uncharacterized protein N0V89_000075 [Didymosphaeria variabile]KAJ4359520.1 hypothetical protein N0V89_000075 [Didymosphaeria variabile]